MALGMHVSPDAPGGDASPVATGSHATSSYCRPQAPGPQRMPCARMAGPYRLRLTCVATALQCCNLVLILYAFIMCVVSSVAKRP